MKTPLLLHICCGPCGVAFTEGIIAEGFAPALLWYNPNIHPYMEYRHRRTSAVDFAGFTGLPINADEKYGLKEFLSNTMSNEQDRCAWCYRTRLERTAQYAIENGYGIFSTALLASPYQDFESICRFGTQTAKKYDLQFIVKDFRVGYRTAMDKARKMGLYMQKYCGCIFSEEERFR